MKKIFIIGPIIGAIAAIVLKKKGKKELEPEVQGAAQMPSTPPPAAPAADTSSPA